MPGHVTHHGSVLRITFDYDPRLVEMVKGVPGRRWNPDDKVWTVPTAQVVQLVELLTDEGFTFDESVQALYEQRKDPGDNHYTVSRLNAEVRKTLQSAFPSPVWVVGEIAGFGKSAHKPVVDFQLVDRDEEGRTLAQTTAVLFSAQRKRIDDKLSRAGEPFRLEDEVIVRVLAQVDLHPEWGAYRVVVQDLDVAYTLGEAARRREEILRTLSVEGILKKNRERAFPSFPLRVGLITSIGSDAERDVLNHLRKTAYAFQVTVHDARVQGRQTESSVLTALDWFASRSHSFDVLLICRGGGSRTDLGWFDSVALARSVAHFPLPVIVGIGHEQDRSVLDEIGWPAATPTAAAHMVALQVETSLDRLENTWTRLSERATHRLEQAAQHTQHHAQRLTRSSGQLLSRAERDRLYARHRLANGARVLLRSAGQTLVERGHRLPHAVRYLLRGQAHNNAGIRRRLLLATHRQVEREAERNRMRVHRLLQAARPLLNRARTERMHAQRRMLRGSSALLLREQHSVLTRMAQLPRAVRYLLREQDTHYTDGLRRLARGSKRLLAHERERTDARAHRLALAHPHNVLERGFALLRSEEGRVITATRHAPRGAHVEATLKEGRLRLRSEGPAPR